MDGAEISPEVVGGFMSLQRELQHFTTLLEQWRESLAQASIAGSARTPAADGRDLRARADALHDECVETRRMAVKVLDGLDVLLAPPPAPRSRRAGARSASASAASAAASPRTSACATRPGSAPRPAPSPSSPTITADPLGAPLGEAGARISTDARQKRERGFSRI